MILYRIFVASMLTSTSHGFSSASTSSPSSRANFLQQVAGVTVASVLTVPVDPVHAASSADPAVKGTKKDPAYEACVSKCMYECTKPKGQEQKSRQECLPECKQKCATTKEQLLLGTPKSSS